ncbi:alkaline phosphatase-like protein [Pseudovirgaria hyperparasitica]|uniref:Alkaline phosphatase n=1 Tax=Pseudovirgaria hyperparasitica TaxID=470096 RepID=A0A6A6W0W5_9PEZI|nr:alkaline phosphatase-like protein [Pseudovirgaria hyperparasitica]KAF2755217.1 alkaline phosphatase-like protein [Pseudovirgaria hyperparasitica]
MAGDEEPLFSQRPSSEHTNDRDLAEEDALLTGERTGRSAGVRGWKFWREVGLFAWAVIATAAVIVLGVVYQRHQQSDSPQTTFTGKRNLIFMVSDGMGPTSLTLTREYLQNQNNLPWGAQLEIDKHLIGQSRTRSTSSLVTDSAAGATAFSCGIKSYNGAISVLPDHSPCGSVMEAAKKAGYTTGLVVTTRITDATPAVFASHVNMRDEEDLIATQMVGEHPLGHVVDLMLGGGRAHFLPNTVQGSARADDRDITELAKSKGYTYISTREEFDALDHGASLNLPFLGLFADTDIPYEVDRRTQNATYPALHEMATTALRALSAATAHSDHGFFIMIEGSRIDHAGHANDPVAQVHEVLAYDAAISAVLDFIHTESTPTLMLSTSDHETGGLATARQLHPSYPDYAWFPGVLANASKSAERLGQEYHAQLSDTNNNNNDTLKTWLTHALEQDLGIHDHTPTELTTLLTSPATAPYTFADMVSRRAQTGWSTHGHSGADVNIYASDPRAAAPLVGNHENSEVGQFLADFLDVDLAEVTEELREKAVLYTLGWMGRVPGVGERLDGQDHVDHYLGDFRRRGRRCVGGVGG